MVNIYFIKSIANVPVIGQYIQTSNKGVIKMAGTKKEALQRAFEIWYEQEHGSKPERGVFCAYIEDDPLMAWSGWEKGFEIGEKSGIALNSAAPALLEALESALKTAEFEKHPFRAWHDKARAAIAAARGDA